MDQIDQTDQMDSIFFAFEPDMSNGQWCNVVLVHNVVGSQLNHYSKCNHTLTICLLCTLNIYNAHCLI